MGFIAPTRRDELQEKMGCATAIEPATLGAADRTNFCGER